MTGIELIAMERERQIDVEGYSRSHDDRHSDGVLAVIAAGLAVDGTDAIVKDPHWRVQVGHDTWGLVEKHGYHGTRPDRVRALTIAGALIAAEIDRVQRTDRVSRLSGA